MTFSKSPYHSVEAALEDQLLVERAKQGDLEAFRQIVDRHKIMMFRIAKTHPNRVIRKQAIFWLGQSDDPRAFDTIVEIAEGK